MDQRSEAWRDTLLQRRLASATDAELRSRVQLLVEQCEREEAAGTSPLLHVMEIYTLLGLGIGADRPEGLICVDPRCPAGRAHYGPCPGPHRKDGETRG